MVGSDWAVFDGDMIALETALEGDASTVCIRTGATDRPVVQAQPCQTCVDICDRTWALLDEFVAKTYAPTTEASRLKSLDAGLTDND